MKGKSDVKLQTFCIWKLTYSISSHLPRIHLTFPYKLYIFSSILPYKHLFFSICHFISYFRLFLYIFFSITSSFIYFFSIFRLLSLFFSLFSSSLPFFSSSISPYLQFVSSIFLLSSLSPSIISFFSLLFRYIPLFSPFSRFRFLPLLFHPLLFFPSYVSGFRFCRFLSNLIFRLNLYCSNSTLSSFMFF